MLLVPLSTDRYLEYVVGAAESADYAALLVILARAADAREQHEEIVRDWTDLHDVTGPLMAVVCPEPNPDGHPQHTPVGGGAGVAALGLRINHGSTHNEGLFSRNFSNSEAVRGEIESYGRAIRNYAHPFPSHSSIEHSRAFTEAVSRCSAYFGIYEGQLPALLFLSFWDRVAVLIPVAPNLSLYRLSKAITEGVETRTNQISQAVERVRNLEHELSSGRHALQQVRRPYEKWCDKVNALHDRLGQGVDVFGEELIGSCQKQMKTLLESGEPGELPEILRQIHAHVAGVSMPPVSHSDVWGVLDKLQKRCFPLPPRPTLQERIDKISRLEIELKDARATAQALRDQLHLSDVIIERTSSQLGAIEEEAFEGSEVLDGWTLRRICPVAPQPIEMLLRRA